MRIALSSPVTVDGVAYTHVACSVAMSGLMDTTSVAVRLVPERQVGGVWESGADLPGLAALASSDVEVDAFASAVVAALGDLLAAKGL